MAKYLDSNGLLYFWQKIKSAFITDVSYSSSTKKITKTKNGSSSDIVTLSDVATSGSYDDLSNKPTIPTVPSAYTSNPVMDGTASPGTSTQWAKGDHVHPRDTSRAPVSHASTSTTYGVGTDANYGHVKLSNATNSTSGVNAGTAATPKAVSDALSAAKTYADTAVGNSVTGVKGNTESSFRTGNVNLTPANIGALALTGGTLIGNLDMDDSVIEIEDSSIDIGTAPSSVIYDRIFRIVDKNGDQVGFLQATQTANGSHFNCFGSPNSNDSEQNQLMLGWDINDNPKISVSYPDIFRDAIGAATSSHTHGNITNDGDITANTPTIASGDKLIINDESASKITNGPAFGGDASKFLCNDGSWDTPTGTYTHPSYTAHTTSQLYKFTNDAQGHVDSATAATASDIVSLLGTTAVNRATADASGNNIASTYAPKASPALTGTPTAPTATAGTNTTQIATTAFVKTAVDNAITDVSGAMVYKGVVDDQTDITGTSYKKGWYWIVAMPNASTTSITIGGVECEAGDMVIAKQDKTATLANDIDVVQTNIAVITNAEIDTIVAA